MQEVHHDTETIRVRFLRLGLLVLSLGAGWSPTQAQQPGELPGLLTCDIDHPLAKESHVKTITDKVHDWLRSEPEIRFVVFRLNLRGGLVDACARLGDFIKDLRDFNVTTIAFIPPSGAAYSAGVLPALAADHLVMGTDAAMGIPPPSVAVPFRMDEQPQEDITKARRKIQYYVRHRPKDAPYPPLLSEALVDPTHPKILRVKYLDGRTEYISENDYKAMPAAKRVETQGGDPPVQLAAGSPLTVGPQEARNFGFIDYVCNDLNEIRANLAPAVPDDRVFNTQTGRLTPSSEMGQNIIDICNHPVARFFLLLVGCLGVVLEFKMLGTLIPGLIGLACFVVFFLTSYLPVTGSPEGTASVLEILFFVVGLGVMAFEFVTPLGLFALVGMGVCALTIVLAMVPSGEEAVKGHLTFEGAVTLLLFSFGTGMLAFFALLRWLPKSSLSRKTGLVSDAAIVGVPTAESSLEAQAASIQLIDQVGTVVTTLRPAGKIQLADGRLFDVIASGEFIPAGERVRITECSGGRIVVERVET